MQTYTITPVRLDHINARDLIDEARDIEYRDGTAACYRGTVWPDPEREPARIHPEALEVVWCPEMQRGGIAWGGNAEWADAASVEALVNMYLNDPGEYARNN